jgi:hypothetical protein
MLWAGSIDHRELIYYTVSKSTTFEPPRAGPRQPYIGFEYRWVHTARYYVCSIRPRYPGVYSSMDHAHILGLRSQTSPCAVHLHNDLPRACAPSLWWFAQARSLPFGPADSPAPLVVVCSSHAQCKLALLSSGDPLPAASRRPRPARFLIPMTTLPCHPAARLHVHATAYLHESLVGRLN